MEKSNVINGSTRKRAINKLARAMVRAIECGRISVFITYAQYRQFCGQRPRGTVQTFVCCTEGRGPDGRWMFVQERTERTTAHLQTAIQAALSRAGTDVLIYKSAPDGIDRHLRIRGA